MARPASAPRQRMAAFMATPFEEGNPARKRSRLLEASLPPGRSRSGSRRPEPAHFFRRQGENKRRVINMTLDEGRTLRVPKPHGPWVARPTRMADVGMVDLDTPPSACGVCELRKKQPGFPILGKTG